MTRIVNFWIPLAVTRDWVMLQGQAPTTLQGKTAVEAHTGGWAKTAAGQQGEGN